MAVRTASTSASLRSWIPGSNPASTISSLKLRRRRSPHCRPETSPRQRSSSSAVVFGLSFAHHHVASTYAAACCAHSRNHAAPVMLLSIGCPDAGANYRVYGLLAPLSEGAAIVAVNEARAQPQRSTCFTAIEGTPDLREDAEERALTCTGASPLLRSRMLASSRRVPANESLARLVAAARSEGSLRCSNTTVSRQWANRLQQVQRKGRLGL